MITKEQAVALQYRDGVHCTIRHECKRTIGPRGGVKETVTHARVNGAVQTWKTRPDAFRVPIKAGLYEYGEITESNAQHFHKPEDCPAGIGF